MPYLFYLALAFLLMLCWRPAQAQQTPTIKTPKVGDRMPDVLITNIENYKTSQARISDFKGKLLILDFWASWCSVCASMLPKIDSLQKQFEGRIQILPVAYQDAATINTFLERYHRRTGRRIDLPEVMADTVLHALFPHQFVPHYVWIDKDGIIAAITSKQEMTPAKISAALAGSSDHLVQRKEHKSIPYTGSKPLLVNGNGGSGENLLFHSLLTGYTQGLSGGMSFQKADSARGQYKITLRNQPIARLYQEAFGERKVRFAASRTIIETDKEILTGKAFSDKVCYELITAANGQSDFFTAMRNDLKRMFPQYTATLEKKKTRCLALQRIAGAPIPKSSGGPSRQLYGHFDGQGVKLINSDLPILLYNLSAQYLQHSALPVVDDTGIDEKIDLEIDASLSDVRPINRQLTTQGLTLSEQEIDIDILVIRPSSALSHHKNPN